MESKYYLPGIEIIKKIRKLGFESYFVGGYVRDMLLNKITANTEIDISTNATPEQLRKIFPKAKEVGKIFGVTLIIYEGLKFEIATFRKDISYSDGRRPSEVKFSDIREDSLRRDITINSIYLDPLNGEFINLVGGKEDLKKKHIKFIGKSENRIEEDYLRILRTVRFKNKLDFQYSDETKKALKKFAYLSKEISPERINEELTKILIDKNRSKAFLDLYNFGILKHILPEIDKMVQVDQPKNVHAEGNVFTHTMLVLNSARRIKNKKILWSLLLHDVGKPATLIVTDRIRFPKHQKVGVDIGKTILKRLKFSQKEQTKICWLIEHHMMLPDILLMKPNRRNRFFSHPWFKDLIKVFKSDVSGCRPFNLDLYNEVLNLYLSFKKEKKPVIKKLLTGDDVMKILKIGPGPKVGEVLKEIDEMYLEGKINSREEALSHLMA